MEQPGAHMFKDLGSLGEGTYPTYSLTLQKRRLCICCISNTRLSLVNSRAKKTKIFPPVSQKVQRNKAKCLYKNYISI